jgi:DNA-binding beta-propeller fold protein YncE
MKVFATTILSLLLAATVSAADYTVKPLPLPGGTPAGIAMDYISFHAATNTVWVPAGATGAVDVIDASTKTIRQVTGFPTKEVTVRDRKRVMGPSSVTFGDGEVFIGNRGDNSVCAVNPKTLVRGRCQVLESMPDGLAYVAPTKEVWVTTPRDNSIRILDADTLHEKTKLTFEGNPEGFAVDAKRHRFYTNLEDKDRTLAIDLTSHKTVATWNPACGEEGPHGLRVDEKAGHLFVACSAKVEVLNAGGDGAIISSIDTGNGVDDFDYASGLVYVGAARDGKLTIARADSSGHLSLVATVPTAAGARNPAVAKNGDVFLAHGGGVASSDLIVASPAPSPEPTQAELEKEAKISMEKARDIALAKVPHGKIASEELEREHGKLIYSFDIKTSQPGVTEVNVDAMNGHVIDVHHETPKAEATEKKQEAKHPR